MSDARSALLAAYLARRDDLVRFFALRLKSEAAAEDLVQDIYLRAAAVPRDLEVRNAAAYLYRLGSNLMLDRIRGARRTAARDYAWRESHRTIVESEEVAEEPSAEAAIAARQRLAAVVAVLGELPEQTQKVFRLHKFEGLSHAEVAERLGISRSGVEKHVMAVLRRLAERLD
jgi:RNA polymerase sigma-70 factor (ECF subfamily)